MAGGIAGFLGNPAELVYVPVHPPHQAESLLGCSVEDLDIDVRLTRVGWYGCKRTKPNL